MKPGVVTYCKPYCVLIIYNGGAGAGAKDDFQDRAGFEKKHVDDQLHSTFRTNSKRIITILFRY